MTRLMIALSSVLLLALAPLSDAKSSSDGSASGGGGGYQGKIQGVSTTNFTMGMGGKGKHHRRGGGGLKAMVVHYNPDTTTVTIDGEVVHSLDVRVTGKYVTVYGTIKDSVLEATSISVSSSAPAHAKKSKSSQ